MALRAAGVIRSEIAQLALPMPLEVLVLRAINAEGADGCHERLVYAWEIAIQVSASACWAVCRHLGLRSDALDAIRAKLARPSFGHWLELLRASRALLAGRKEAAAVALAPLLDGLERKWEEDPRFIALAERMKGLPKKPIKVGGRTVAALLDALPAYRNETKGHGEPDTEFRDGSIDALANGLVAFARTAPLIGDFRIAVVHRLEKDEDGTHSAELAMMERTLSAIERVDGLTEAKAGGLQPARAYLRDRDDAFVPLFPAAAAVRGDDGWALGWMKQQVRVPTVSFESSIAGAFSLAVEKNELDTLFRTEREEGGSDAARDGASDEALALDPWRGLLAYGEEHRELFFGRGAEVIALGSRLREKGAVILCGASGSGKSSLMRAGILPRLRAEAAERGAELAPVVMFPGAHPLAALKSGLNALAPADAIEATRWSTLVDEMLGKPGGSGLVHLARGLSATGRHLALLVDQLEEASTLCADASERQAFLDLVCALASEGGAVNAAVVATVRADKIGALLEHEGLRALVRKGLEPVATLGRDALLEVVTGPLRGRRVAIEAGLAERIAADVGDEPGGLALVSQVLASLWDERGRHGDRLTIAGYDALGGVTGVLGIQAEAARRESENEKLDAVLVQLAQRGEDGGFTRRRVSADALAESIDVKRSELDAMIEPFVKRRLLVVGEGTVEVAHEMLLRGWVTLRELLERESAITELRQHIVQAATDWTGARSRGESGELWTDATSNLRRAEELIAAKRIPLAKRERDFIDASRRAVRRGVRLKRGAMGVVGISFLAAVGLAYIAFIAKGAAEAHSRNAQHSIEMARDAFVAQARTPNPDWNGRSDAIANALRALELDRRLGNKPERATLDALSAAVTQGRSLVDGYVVEGSGAAIAPDLLVVAAERGASIGSMRVYRAATREVVREIDGVRGYVGINGDNAWLNFDGRQELYNVRTGEHHAVMDLDWAYGVGEDRWIAQPTKPDFSQPFVVLDGKGNLVAPIRVRSIMVDKQREYLKLSAKSKRIALVAGSDCVKCAHALVDMTDGRIVSELPVTVDAEFSPDGTALYLMRTDGVLERRDPADGHVVATVKVGGGDASLMVSGDGANALIARVDTRNLVIARDAKLVGNITDIQGNARGWVDADTFYNCPKCRLYSASRLEGFDWNHDWTTHARPVTTDGACRMLLAGGGTFSRVTCDGKTTDRGATDALLDGFLPSEPLGDDTLLAKSTQSGKNGIKVWPRGWPSVATVLSMPRHRRSFVDSDTQRAWVYQTNEKITVFDRDGKELWRYDEPVDVAGKHGELAAYANDRGIVRVFDGPGKKLLYELTGDALPKMPLRAVSLDAAGKLLIVPGEGEVAAFDAMTGKPISGVMKIEEKDARVEAVAPDGCHFALGYAYQYSVWDACAKKKIVTVDAGAEGELIMSADGRRALIGGSKIPLKVFDTSTGAELAAFADADARFRFAISADGSRVAARGPKGATCVWKVGSSEPARCLPSTSRMSSVALSKNGSRAVISDDAGVRVYDVEARTIVSTVLGYTGRASFFGDDSVATTHEDQLVVWKLGETDLMRAACWHAQFRPDFYEVQYVCKAHVDAVRQSLGR